MTRLPPIPRDAEALDAVGILRIALDSLGRERVALAASFGPESIVLIDLLARLEPRARVFTLDTGRLHQETYDLMDEVRRRYGLEVEVVFPEAEQVQAMVRAKGVNLFFDSVERRLECCAVRKVEPLGRILGTVDGWISGLRRDQISTRAGTPKIGPDDEHGGIWKVAPLADWSADQVWTYIRQHDLPYNTLYDRGYPSVGCAPCTRAVEPGEDPRSGRWWWEEPDQRECGIHVDASTGRMVRARSTTRVEPSADAELAGARP